MIGLSYFTILKSPIGSGGSYVFEIKSSVLLIKVWRFDILYLLILQEKEIFNFFFKRFSSIKKSSVPTFKKWSVIDGMSLRMKN